MKYVPKRQEGMTGIALAVSIAVLIFFVWLAIILYPIYYEHFKVVSHLSSLSRDNDLTAMSESDIIEALLRTYSVDDVDNVRAEDISIVKAADKITVTIQYEVRANVLGNVDVIVDFKNEENYKP